MPITSVVYDQRQNHARKPHGVFQLKRYEGNIIHDDNNRPRKPCNIRSCLETGNAFETVTRQCEGIRSNFQLVRVPPHLSLYGMIDTQEIKDDPLRYLGTKVRFSHKYSTHFTGNQLLWSGNFFEIGKNVTRTKNNCHATLPESI